MSLFVPAAPRPLALTLGVAVVVGTLASACGGAPPPPDRASAAPAVQLGFPPECPPSAGRTVAFLAVNTDLDVQELLFRYQEEYGLPSGALAREDLAPGSTADDLLQELGSARVGLAIAVTDLPFEDGRLWARSGSVGVVSLTPLQSSTNSAAAYSRMYKLVTRILGEAYCGLPPSEQSRSILFEGLDQVSDVDAADESIW